MKTPSPGHVVTALSEFVLFDICCYFGLAAVRRMAQPHQRRRRDASAQEPQQIREALNWACSLYVKRAYCLQRSWTLTRMLRRRGIPASLVIGYKPALIESHAWVELDGTVFSDEGKDHHFFQVLDRW